MIRGIFNQLSGISEQRIACGIFLFLFSYHEKHEKRRHKKPQYLRHKISPINTDFILDSNQFQCLNQKMTDPAGLRSKLCTPS
jgi:hypothetical protein